MAESSLWIFISMSQTVHAQTRKNSGSTAPGTKPSDSRVGKSNGHTSNRAWQKISVGTQAKLRVGVANGPHERQAERVSRLFGKSDSSNAIRTELSPIGPQIQAACRDCRHKEDSMIQLKSHESTPVTAPPTQSILESSLQRGGSQLPDTHRLEYESAFGENFSEVRIHTDTEASLANERFNSRAFAIGKHIHFGQGEYSPTTLEGKKLLAHELTHVVQQSRYGAQIQRQTQVVEAVDEIMEALEGFTSGNDSELIRDIIMSRQGGVLKSLMVEYFGRAIALELNNNQMLNWLYSDLAGGDDLEVKRHIMRERALPDYPYHIAREVKDRLEGWTSEADSREILEFFSYANTEERGAALIELESQTQNSKRNLSEWIYGDLDRVSLLRTARVFLSGGMVANDYAARFIAYKVYDLLAGYTSRTDSESVITNFRESGFAAPIMLARLDELTREGRSEDAEKALMSEMHPEDYMIIQTMPGVRLNEYSLIPGTLDQIGWGWDWIGGILQYGICGIAGIATGLVSVIYDLIIMVWDILVAVYHLLGALLNLLTFGLLGRGSLNAVKSFFTNLGKLFNSPGDAFNQWWEEVSDSFGTIEGPFTECRQAEFIVRRVVNAFVTVCLVLAGGYGIAKGIASGVRSIAGLAQAARAGRLVTATGHMGARAVTAGRKVVDTTVRLAGLLARGLLSPSETLVAIGNQLSLIKLANVDIKVWAWMRGRGGAIIESERQWWIDWRDSWSRTALEHERKLFALEPEVASTTGNNSGLNNRVGNLADEVNALNEQMVGSEVGSMQNDIRLMQEKFQMTPRLDPATGRVRRIYEGGASPSNVTEVPIADMNSLHAVPRRATGPKHIESLATKIGNDGFIVKINDVPTVTVLPDGTMMITGGHHRIAAMGLLGELTVPVRIMMVADTPPRLLTHLGKLLGIGRVTGRYRGSWFPALTNANRDIVARYLGWWQMGNPEQVVMPFRYEMLLPGFIALPLPRGSVPENGSSVED